MPAYTRDPDVEPGYVQEYRHGLVDEHGHDIDRTPGPRFLLVVNGWVEPEESFRSRRKAEARRRAFRRLFPDWKVEVIER